MDTLLELTAILDRKRLSKIDILDKTFLNSNNDNLYYKLYSGLVSQKYTTDQIACKALYGTDKPDHRYRMLKSRLRSKLLKTLLLIDPDVYFINNERNKTYYECAITLNTIELLVKIRGINKIIYELIKEKYDVAEQFKFYDILKSYSYYLLSYHSLKGETKKYDTEYKKYIEYIESADYELKVKQLTSRIMLLYTDPVPINKEFHLKIKICLDKLLKIINIFPDPEAIFFYYYSFSHYQESLGNYRELLKVSKKIEDLFSLYPIVATKGRITVNKINQIKTFTRLKEYSKANNSIEEMKLFLPENGSLNWFLSKEYEFILYLQNKNIFEASAIYNEVINNKYFKLISINTIERWKIYKAYLVFLDNYIDNGDFKFSTAKFINEVTFYAKDKSGFNFAIRVIEILFLFAKKQYNVIFAKMDALKVYRTRYLNDDAYLRSRLFLNALFKAEKQGFNAKLMKKGYPEIVQLTNKSKQYIIAEWEVLPYEMIWDILTDLAKE